QREKWEQEYAEAQARWEAHKRQVAKGIEEEAAATETTSRGGATYSSDTNSGGTLADDASLAALREKLSSNS
ncbi:MAG: 30S ribosomal protein S1, partial [Humibacter sp.]